MTRICLIAGNLLEAKRFAEAQNWEQNCWFYPHTMSELLFKKNFHVLVIGTAGENSAPDVFEKLYRMALQRGRIGRF